MIHASIPGSSDCTYRDHQTTMVTMGTMTLSIQIIPPEEVNFNMKMESASDERRLAQEYFQKVISDKDFVSFQKMEPDPDIPVECFQM